MDTLRRVIKAYPSLDTGGSGERRIHPDKNVPDDGNQRARDARNKRYSKNERKFLK